MHRLLQRISAGAAAILASVGMSPPLVPNDEAIQLFAHSGSLTAGLRMYTSAVHVDFLLRTFPYLRFHVNGHTTFQEPDDFSVQFEHVPWFAKGFEHIKMDALEPQTWPQRYDVSSLVHQGDRTILEMRDKIAGNVKNVHAEFDASGLRQVVWSYVNGGRISVELNLTTVDGVTVPASESADIHVPGYHVVAHATFSDYSVTKGSPASEGEAASR
jgi:hypothetical protein